MTRPRFVSPCVADRYVDKARERIAEFSFPDTPGPAGGLISLRQPDQGPPVVTVYRADGCKVRGPNDAALCQAITYLYERAHRYLVDRDKMAEIRALVGRVAGHDALQTAVASR